MLFISYIKVMTFVIIFIIKVVLFYDKHKLVIIYNSVYIVSYHQKALIPTKLVFFTDIIIMENNYHNSLLDCFYIVTIL